MYDTIYHYFLKFLRRKVYPRLFMSHILKPPQCEMDLQKSNDLIYDALSGDKPCMIARLGASEMSVISNYIYVTRGKQSIIRYIKGYGGEWWWNQRSLQQLNQWSGVFPSTIEIAERFSRLSIADCKEVDVLGSWIPEEALLSEELKHSIKVQLFNLEPFFATNPWTRCLSGKKVLVVHPFKETICAQYERRTLLFKNQDILPKFDLIVYKSVQSISGNTDYANWFDALHKMEQDIDKIDFEIAIIGCGAYGFSLAAHIKRSGKKAVHLGGATQLLFGIKGKRWEMPTTAMSRNGYYPDLFNEYWCKPGENERPKNANKVENGCYW